ncbi:4-(cytidine 5'-diphospho)-2-C-methyl-D-erythritol kinase [Nigerium massiliense]|uniref:4-(cytidine 5'-diphospho)-2-C-methyl-D-erythritol kinase n=1 Tax=Nigerium massiliense TaxID=1522317 RepID=UPI00058C21AC|nr:4-(cytidine 5'-diphospho)-2-C-methyl-D-erythritol kinase [Nigerium massiliense]
MQLRGEADEWVRVRAAGKINLALKVGPVQPDGYHPLATVFQAVSLVDEVAVRTAPAGEFGVTMTGEQSSLVPTGDANLAVRAAKLLAERYGDPGRLGAEIRIRKAIPVTGGMAGGSADCAAALLACSVLWDLDVGPAELAQLGGMLGADVPFALHGQTALGKRRGDRLVPVLSRGCYHWVLAFADFELSTAAVFRLFDQMDDARPERDLDVPPELLAALAAGDPVALAPHLVNDLAEPAMAMRPELATLLDAGKELGALASLLSGSGPTCAFLAADESAAIDLSVKLSSLGLCRAVRRVAGPVPGAQLII